uniref:Uncharacterized protein n=6 Tax=Australaves TaxID=3073809 RepID=A0A8B9J0F3_9PSIT
MPYVLISTQIRL